MPAIEIKPTPNSWLSTIPNLNLVNQIIFTSANAVQYFIAELNKSYVNLPEKIIITAIGKASAQRLKELDVIVHQIPDSADSENLLALPNMQKINQQQILLVKGLGGRELIENELNNRLAKVIPVIVYERCMPIINDEYINSIWRNNLVDIILFTSYQSMQNIFRLFGDEAKDWLINKPCIVISQRLAMEARSLGLRNVIIAAYNDILATLKGFKYDE